MMKVSIGRRYCIYRAARRKGDRVVDARFEQAKWRTAIDKDTVYL